MSALSDEELKCIHKTPEKVVELKMATIPVVDAKDMPKDVEDWCADNDISTHCQNDIICVEDNGNPFAVWLKSLGYQFTLGEEHWIAIFAT